MPFPATQDHPCPKCGQLLSPGEDCVLCLFRHISPKILDETPLPCRLGDYELICELGQGGMGKVHRAHHLTLQREAAVKTVHAPLGYERESRRRFLVESRALSKLAHPGILQIYECGEDSGHLWFAMPYARLGSLKEMLDSLRNQWRRIAHIVASIARAIHYAHERGVIHRDLKPSNILFNEQDNPCIADFGIARLVEEEGASRTLTGERQIGTPAYMSPELLTGQIPGATIASDIYSVGVILYELLTDRQPRTGRSLAAQIAEVQTGEPPLPAKLKANVPRDLSTITARAISSDLGKRYKTAADLAMDLENWLEHRPIEARPVGVLERTRLWARRRPLPATLVGLLAVLAAGSAVFLTKAWLETQTAMRTASTARDLAESRVDYMMTKIPALLRPLGRVDLVMGPFQDIAKYYEDAEKLSPDASMDARHALFLLQSAEVKAALAKNKSEPMGDLNEAVRFSERALTKETPPDLAWYVAVQARLAAAAANSHYSEQATRAEHRKRASELVEQGMRAYPASPVMKLTRFLREKARIESADLSGGPAASVAAAKDLVAAWEPILEQNPFSDQLLFQEASLEGFTGLLNFAGWKSPDRAEAAGFLEKAVKIREDALKLNSEDLSAKVALSESYEQLGVNYLNSDGGDSTRARGLLEKSRQFAQETAIRDKTNLHAQVNWATSEMNHAYTIAEDSGREKDKQKAGRLAADAIKKYKEAVDTLSGVGSKDESLNARALAFEGVAQYRIAELYRQENDVKPARDYYVESVYSRFKYLNYQYESWREHDSFIEQLQLSCKALGKIDCRDAVEPLLTTILADTQSIGGGVISDSSAFANWQYTESAVRSLIAEELLAAKNLDAATAQTRNALSIRLKLLTMPEMAQLIVKTVPEPLTIYLKNAPSVNESEVLAMAQELYASLPAAIELDPKTFPRAEWAAAFVAVRGKLKSAPSWAAGATAKIFPAGMPLSNAELELKQRLLGQ